jgi:hypothetical protein
MCRITKFAFYKHHRLVLGLFPICSAILSTLIASWLSVSHYGAFELEVFFILIGTPKIFFSQVSAIIPADKMKLRITAKPRNHMIDLSNLSPYPNIVPPDHIELDDAASIEEYIFSQTEQLEELIEAVRSLIEEEFEDRIPNTIFFYYDYTEDQRLYYGILTRMFETSFNEEEYISVNDEPLSDEEASDSSFSSSSSSTIEYDDQDCEDNSERDVDDDEPEARVRATGGIPAIPRPQGIPQPKVSSAYMEELSVQRTRSSRESAAAASRPTRVKTNFVEPDRPPHFQGIEPVKLRPGIDMEKFEYNGTQITVFKNTQPGRS